MRFDVLTLFPDIIYHYLSDTILSRAEKNDLIKVVAHNFRQFSGNKYGHVDDKPYGGGPGMILRVEPIFECLKAIGVLSNRNGRSVILRRPKADEGFLKSDSRDSSPFRAQNDKTKIILMDPAGQKFDQGMAAKFSKLDNLVIICGRYEGFDARLYDFVDERVSVGDYVLAGGELPALTIIEATSRLVPGVLGNEESLKEETFTLDGKEYNQYTRPENFLGKAVPPVLLSGDHKKIAEWRQAKNK